MANSRRKCPHCKESQKAETMLIMGTQAFCNKEHYIEYQVNNRTKLASKGRKIKSEIKRKEMSNRKIALRDKSWYTKEAQKWFNKYIRLRDNTCSDHNCISCNRPLRKDFRLYGHLFDAGHYLSVGARPNLRFNEDNCHAQCVKCNRELSGNAAEYRINLVARVGQERVDKLECNNTPAKYTIDDLKEIIAKYKLKCKDIS